MRLRQPLSVHLRSGLGATLRMQECATARPSCDGCPERAGCNYLEVFESPGAGGGNGVTTHTPHPFVLGSAFSGELIRAGDCATVQLTLIGPAMEGGRGLLRALVDLGASGRCCGYFRVAAVRSVVEPERAVFSVRGRELGQLRPWEPEMRIGGSPIALRLRFSGPVRLKGVSGAPLFADIWRSLIRRISLLSEAWGEGLDPAERDRLLKLCDGVQTVESLFAETGGQRYSARQRSEVPMNGLTGEVVAAGSVEPLLPYLWAGQWLHVGSSTAMGYGAYELDLAF
jgi:hypothetical protein